MDGRWLVRQRFRMVQIACLISIGSAWLGSGTAHAQNTRAKNLVASFEAAPNRPLIAPKAEMQAYGGIAGDASYFHGGRVFALPLGGGTGLSQRTELGVDTAVAILPLPDRFPVDRLRGYGRVLLAKDILALQFGVWSPVKPGDPVSFEAMAPARISLGRVHLFGQAKTLYAVSPIANVFVAGGAVTALVEVVGPLYSGADLGTGLMIQEVDTPPATPLVGASTAVHAGVKVMGSTFIKARFALPSLSAIDPETGAWAGLNDRVFDLMVVKSIDFRRSKDDSVPAPPD